MNHRVGAALAATVTLLTLALAPAAGAQGRDPGPASLASKDRELQAALTRVLQEAPFRRLVRQQRLSVALVDLSDPNTIRYAGVDDDRMRYAASLPKIAILLGVFDQIQRGAVSYTPPLREMMELMIRRSSNSASTDLIRLVGFPAIANALRDPRHDLYSPRRNGGLWVGKDYGGGLGYWRRDPLHHLSHGATARQVARFFVLMDRGELVSPWASAEMRDILGNPELHHKFVAGLEEYRPSSVIFRKSGTWRQWHADAALVERDGKKYVAVALLESPNGQNVLPQLIVRLDDIIYGPARRGPQVTTAAAERAATVSGDLLPARNR